LGYLFHKWYFGFEPKSVIQDILYARKLKKAVAQRIRRHKDTAVSSVHPIILCL